MGSSGPDNVWQGRIYVSNGSGARKTDRMTSLGITHILDLSGGDEFVHQLLAFC